VISAETLVELLLAVVLLAGFAQLVSVPYPVVLVLGGAALGFLPGPTQVRLDPEVVLFVFLPPLLYSAAFLSSPAELRANARPIFLLAVGRVIATMLAVAACAHVVLDLDWALGLVLGAIVSPTDPVAATSILRRLGAPRRVAVILEGDALVNDGSGLVLYKLALGAVAGTTLSLPAAGGDFVLVAAGGAAVGLAAGWLSALVRRSFEEPRIEITISILTPFAAYIPASRLGLSGVLAAVAAGLYVSHQSAAILSAETRLRYYAFWEVVTFLLNAILFLLVGLQLRAILENVTSGETVRLLLEGVLISVVVIAIRLVWMFTVAPLTDLLPGPSIARDWRERIVFGWSGMRGAVSLAAALALPLTVSHRDQLIVVTFVVIVVTLVLPGLTLPALITGLGLRGEESVAEQAPAARETLARAALARLDELGAGRSDEELADLRALYEARLRRLAGQRPDYANLRLEAIAAERAALAELRAGGLADEVARKLEHDLDLEEARARPPAAPAPVPPARPRPGRVSR